MMAVYIASNSTGEIYVGSAVNLQKRVREHITKLRGHRHHNRFLQAAWDGDDLGFALLEEVGDESCLRAIEQDWIKILRPEMNLNPTAHGCDASVREQISATLKAKPFNPEWGKKSGEARRGKTYGPMSSERRAKISAAKRGKPLSPEHIEWLRKWRTGWKHSEATKIRISSKNFWRWFVGERKDCK